MINKLTPDQIAGYFDAIKYGLQHALPPMVKGDQEVYNNILNYLLTGTMQCWLSSDMTEEGPAFIGFMLTEITTDEASKQRALLVYAIYAFRPVSEEIWQEGQRAIEEFGKANDCKKVIAYTDNKIVLERVKSIGYNQPFYFISKDI